MNAINFTAEAFGCVPAIDTFTSCTKRFLSSTNPKIFHSATQESMQPANFHRLEIEHNTVYTVNVVMIKGNEPNVKEGNELAGILQRDVNVRYNLKLKSSRAAFKEVCEKYGVFPFSLK